jgi:hypothetical protein
MKSVNVIALDPEKPFFERVSFLIDGCLGFDRG